MACLVTDLAQIHRPLSWSSEEARQKYEAKINLEEWDAVAEVTLEARDSEGRTRLNDFSKRSSYYTEIILPDERNLLLSEATKHMQPVDPSSISGERIAFIVEGKPVAICEE